MLSRREGNTATATKALQYVEDFEHAIDGGAHAGEWTALLRPHFSLVTAFEPDAGLFDKLQREYDADPRVAVRSEALLDRSGAGILQMPEEGSAKRRRQFVRSGSGPIRIIDLDGCRFASCGLLKLDIEGGELPALRGAAQLIARFKPVVVVEFKWRNAARYGWNRDDLRSWADFAAYSLAFEAFPNKVFAKR